MVKIFPKKSSSKYTPHNYPSSIRPHQHAAASAVVPNFHVDCNDDDDDDDDGSLSPNARWVMMMKHHSIAYGKNRGKSKRGSKEEVK